MKPVLSQNAALGALPTLFAATAPEIVSGGYYGPDGPFELRGTLKLFRLRRLHKMAPLLNACGEKQNESRALNAEFENSELRRHNERFARQHSA